MLLWFCCLPTVHKSSFLCRFLLLFPFLSMVIPLSLSFAHRFSLGEISHSLTPILSVCLSFSHLVASDSYATPWMVPTRLLYPWDFPDKNNGMGHHFLLQEIFPTQGSNPHLLHYREILYQLSLHAVGICWYTGFPRPWPCTSSPDDFVQCLPDTFTQISSWYLNIICPRENSLGFHPVSPAANPCFSPNFPVQ